MGVAPAEVSLLFAAFSVGTDFVPVKYALEGLPPLVLVPFRYVVAGLLPLAVLRFFGRGTGPDSDPGTCFFWRISGWLASP